MISRTPENSAKLFSEETASLSDGDAYEATLDSKMNQWIDRIAENWSKTVKKASAADALTKSSKKSIKRMCFGISRGLIADAHPLIAHVESGRNEHEFEQLACLAESISSSIQSIDHVGFESHSQEVFDADSTASDLQLLAAFSSLLVSMRIRETVLNGTDLQFERIIRSLQSLQCCISAANEEDAVLLHQWLAIELPMMIASQLISVKPFRKEGKLAAKRFVEVTRNMLDTDGWPGTSCLRHFGALVASWTRCVQLAEDCNFKLGSSFLAQMEWVAEQFVRLHGPKKRLLFSGDGSTKTDPAFAEFVIQLASDDRAREMAIASGLIEVKSKTKPDTECLAEPTCVSEWADSAILKSAWSPKSPVFAIDFSSSHNRIEMAAKETLLSGVATLDVRDDGEPISFDGGFDVVCELNDDEVSYLELEIQQNDIQIFRQLLLSKKDRFLFFADSVNKQGAGEIDYRLKLPLAKNVSVVRENGTREVYLNFEGKGIQSLILPLSLPEWSVERCRGLLLPEQDDDGGRDGLNLEKSVQLQSQGGSLYNPLFIDLDPKRSRQKRTWRSLTVGEGRGIVRPEIASAYRVQVAEQQWIFYRALQSVANRTFMGQNFSGDFYAGRFFSDGNVNELIQVQ